MRAFDIIFKKRNGHTLMKEEIEFFVRGFTQGEIPDYQASAFLMSVFFSGMTAQETTDLTMAMVASGESLNLSGVKGIKVDKHSTGGVGDGISLVLAPLVASCGGIVPMISGRGLGHTGGTLDKLAAIAGFNTQISKEEFVELLKKVGVVLAGQTQEMAPADRRFYALRDVTATIESIPLIAASIMSKKLAEGCDALVLDVKTGSGAFMPDRPRAKQLAKALVEIGKRSGKKVVALITDMNQPLGKAIGNALELGQAIEILKGKEEPATQTFIELTERLGGWMLFLGQHCKTVKEGQEKIRQARVDGNGLKKFREIVQAQGGDPAVCDSPSTLLPKAKKIKFVVSPWKGIVGSMDSRKVGISSMLLGAGREKQESPIDYSAGILLCKKVGDRVERGEPIAEFHFSDSKKFDGAEKLFLSAIKVGKLKAETYPLVYEVVR